MSVADSIVIEAPSAMVWDLIETPERQLLWMPDLIETQFPEGRPSDAKRDVRFRQVRTTNGVRTTFEGRVTDFDEGRVLGIELADAFMILTASYRLTPDGAKTTRLDFRGDVQMRNPLMGWMTMSMWPVMRAMMVGQLYRLKRVAEAEAGAAPKSAEGGA